jgi:hypothetical protein
MNPVQPADDTIDGLDMRQLTAFRTWVGFHLGPQIFFGKYAAQELLIIIHHPDLLYVEIGQVELLDEPMHAHPRAL